MMIETMNIIDNAKNVFEIEISALKEIKNHINDKFEKIVQMLYECEGNVIFTGMGKSGHIAKKISATFSSLGTPSFFLHPAEARHGDLGMLTNKDIVIAISNSGETEEIIAILTNIKNIGAKIIGISANKESELLKSSDIPYDIPKVEEACYLNLAPTSSTTGVLVLGDAIAVCLSIKKGFTKDNFALFHPSGTLGKQLLTKVEDIMVAGEENAVIKIDSSLQETILELASKGLGVVCIVDENNELKGIFTDGDLRRLFSNIDIQDFNNKKIKDIMTSSPVCIEEGKLVVDALNIMRSGKPISALPIVRKGKLCGTVLMRNIARIGIL